MADILATLMCLLLIISVVSVMLLVVSATVFLIKTLYDTWKEDYDG